MNAARAKKVILIVDDESVVTDSLTAFLELETDHRIIATQSPEEGLRLARNHHIDVVICDFLMPEMNGLEFLSRIKKLYPDVPRILLTGYADKENSIRAINEVGLFQYVEKPWDNDQLKLVVDNALANKTLRESLQERIHELDELLLERDRLAERDEHIRGELTTARRLQRSLLPNGLPTSGYTFNAIYQPALEIGGDFYDAIALDGDRTAILVADATGHGIQAALSTAIIKFAFTRFTHAAAGPNEILTGMNRVLARGLPEDTYIAALVAAIDPTGSCHITNAGLPHPFVLRANALGAEPVPATGLMLGMVDESVYAPDEPTRIDLRAGDSLHIYTDGLGDIEDDDGTPFDHGKLVESFSAAAGKDLSSIHDQVVAEGRSFSGAGHSWDDLTLVGIEKL